jgi:response regulator RpfG family c-di-GMP phosphodiesterase
MNAYNSKELQILEAHKRQLAQIEITEREKAQRELAEQTLKGAIILLTRATGLRSEETGEHIIRVPEYSYILAKFYGLSEKDADAMRLVTPLHDIGKIGIPDTVLHKPGALTQDEFAIMKTHTQKGYDFFADYMDNPFLHLAAVIAYTHQEKWDGSGYPQKLKGTDISVYGRIVAVADVFDALCQRRVYKEPMPVEKAIDIIRQGAGTHFEPQLVHIFLDRINDILAIREKYKDKY